MGFQRKQITLPDSAGETLRVDIKGFAVIIEGINLYSSIEEVPLMYFDSVGTREQPLYPQSKYVSAERFKRLIFEATSESVEDTINILVTDACIEPDINISLNLSGKAISFVNQFSKASTDSVQTISDVELTDSDDNLPSSIYVCARTNDIAYAIGSNPDQTDEGKILSAGGQWDKISGTELARSFNFISAANGSAGNLLILPVFE